MSESPWDVPRATSPAFVSSTSLPTSPSQAGLSRRLSWNRGSESRPTMDHPLATTNDPFAPSNHHSDFENPFDDDEEEQQRAGRVAHTLQQPSQTSLVGDFHRENLRGELADDEQRLTSSAQPFWGGVGTGEDEPYDDEDEERRAGNAIKGRRQRYVGSTPMRSASLGGSALRAMSRNLRRMSVRVVDLASSSTRDQGVKLEDNDDDLDEKPPNPRAPEEPIPDHPSSKLRGKTLGLFGPQSRLRLAMFNFLVAPYVPLLPILRL